MALAFPFGFVRFCSILDRNHEWARMNTKSIAAKERIDRKAGADVAGEKACPDASREAGDTVPTGWGAKIKIKIAMP